MQGKAQYHISWKYMGSSIQRADGSTVKIKMRYLLLCYTIGLIGWIPAFLFDSVWKIQNAFLRILASGSCYLGFAVLVIWLFHLHLIHANQKGMLGKYICYSGKS